MYCFKTRLVPSLKTLKKNLCLYLAMLLILWKCFRLLRNSVLNNFLIMRFLMHVLSCSVLMDTKSWWRRSSNIFFQSNVHDKAFWKGFYVKFLFVGGVACTFDTDKCGWTQSTSDDFDWTQRSGSTASSGTGPTNDHTTNTRSGLCIVKVS